RAPGPVGPTAIRVIPVCMTASTDAAPRAAADAMLRRYYLAMAVPFVIDMVTLATYAIVNGAPEILPSSVLMSAAFLVGGIGIGAYLLIRPIRRFLAGELTYTEIEASVSHLPRRSAAVMAACYA